LTLHGLKQYYVQLEEREKTRKLVDLLDTLEFNQCVVFVSSVKRAAELNKILVEQNFPSIAIYRGMQQKERYGFVLLPSALHCGERHTVLTPVLLLHTELRSSPSSRICAPVSWLPRTCWAVVSM
jgi:hypothetical protein